MLEDRPELMAAVRDRFAHVDSCPFQGPRAFFENAGGALTLRSVAETAGAYAALPDNPGRDNPAGRALTQLIADAKADMALLFGAPDHRFVVGESGTELIFRLVRAACLGAGGGRVVSSSLEHPATRSAAAKWAAVAGLEHVVAPHDAQAGALTAQAYDAALTPDTRVATVIHASPVTGMAVDVAAVSARIRAVAPDCVIVVDGIQRAAHGRVDIAACDVDGYVVSPYKMFSRHGYGVAWVGPRLADAPHDHLQDAPGEPWDLGTRDGGAYATFRDVARYFEWLGGQVSDATEPRAKIEAAGAAIHAQETALTTAMLRGTGNLPGLLDLPGVRVIGDPDDPRREGLVSFALEGVASEAIVARLNEAGVRTHLRKADHYSGNALDPLGMADCVRVSACHYNTRAEVAHLLTAMREIAAARTTAA